MKSLSDLKVVTGDDSVVESLKHPVDDGTEKLLIYSTMEELLLKSKSLSLNEEVTITSSITANTSNAETVSELSSATPSKASHNSISKSKKKTVSPNHCRLCEVKHGSKLGNDHDSPWIGC